MKFTITDEYDQEVRVDEHHEETKVALVTIKAYGEEQSVELDELQARDLIFALSWFVGDE